MKTIKRVFVFLFCWVLWMFPAVGDLKESGPDFAGLTTIFLSVAGVCLVSPFIFWAMENIAVRGGGFQTIFGFLLFSFPVGFSLYLVTGIIYHLAVGGYGGASWYLNYKNFISFKKPR